MTSSVDFADLFHVGVRVADLQTAMEDLGQEAGLTWCEVQHRTQAAWIPGQGAVELDLAFTYSAEGPVHTELLQGPVGTVWDGTESPGPHHLGVWVDDVGAVTQALLSEGWTLELAGVAPEDGYGRFTYVRSPSGILVEPVANAVRPAFERWWAGGELG